LRVTGGLRAGVGGIHHRQLGDSATGNRKWRGALFPQSFRRRNKDAGKIAGAMIGEKVAGRNKGAKGAILGAGVAAIARRGFGPLTAAMAIGWGAKKLWDWRKGRSPRYPTDATPS